MVKATVELQAVIKASPAKLKKAAIRTAFFNSIPPDATKDAIAFGASVHPFTSMTPSVRRVIICRDGVFDNMVMNSPKNIVIWFCLLPIV